MAEIAGLVIGSVSLVALFQTCSHAYQKIDVISRYSTDYELLLIKFDLLRTRFELWGETLGLDGSTEAGVADCQAALINNWDRVSKTVGESLVATEFLLQDQKNLEKKYGLKPEVVGPSNAVATTQALAPAGTAGQSSQPANPSRTFAEIRESIKTKMRLRSKQKTVGQVFTWVIKRRDDFRSLVDELSFLVTNLEKVSEHIGAIKRQKGLLETRLQSVQDPGAISLLEEALSSATPTETSQSGSKDDHQPAHRAYISEYIRASVSDRAKQINGPAGFAAGEQPNFAAKYIEPTAKKDSRQINGPVSADALSRFWD